MIEVRCPQCSSELEAPADLAGTVVTCPNCGAPVTVPASASAEVIDVRAVALSGPATESEKEPAYEDDPFFNPEHQRPPSGPMWGRTIKIERAGDGSGCCAMGCVGIVLFIFLAIRGLVSLF